MPSHVLYIQTAHSCLDLMAVRAGTLTRSEGPMVVHTYMLFQYTPFAPGGLFASIDSCSERPSSKDKYAHGRYMPHEQQAAQCAPPQVSTALHMR